MKKLSLLLSFVLFAASPAFSKPPETGLIPPLKFQPPVPDRVTLKNGIVVYMLEDHELPLFELSLKFKTSPADEPEGLRGLLGFMGNVWRSGGTLSRSPDALNDELEFMAAHVETGAGEESAAISLSCLTKDRAKGLEIFKDVLLHPRFSNDQVTLAKAKLVEAIRRKNDSPFDIGRRAFRDLSYGKNHYYSWNPTPAYVGKLKKSEMVALHKKIIVPNQAILAVSGDFDKKALIQELETLFADWPSSSRAVPTFDYSIKDAPTSKIIYVEKDYTQSLIYMGGLGLSRFSPDQYAMTVANYILGEGGPSRLFMQVRSRLGLAYVVGSFYTSPKGPGLAGVVCQTKASSTLEAIEALKKELQKMAQKPAERVEIRAAKDAIVNSFVFRFENAEQVVQEQADLEFYGFPADYLRTYPGKVEAISANDILRVSKSYFDFDKMKIAVVGDRKKFAKPLEELGPVTVVPLGSIE